jgi:hypothetical protein
MGVIAWSPNLTSTAAEEIGARRVSKEELLNMADVVSVHMVLSRRTVGLIGAAELPSTGYATYRLCLTRSLSALVSRQCQSARLLEGTGKRMRHVKLRPGKDVDAVALSNLIDVAYADIRARLGK